MPAPTVTVCVSGSSETICSIDFNERKCCLLSAMWLKQWRVPSTFNWLCFFTNSRTCSSEFAEYRSSVLYSKLPAQFLSLSSGTQAKRRETTGPATVADRNVTMVLLFMAKVAAVILTEVWPERKE